MNRIFRLLSIPLIVALLLTSLAPAALALDRPGRLKIMSAVVQVWWITEENGNLRGGGVGSGTLISADGLVLTNHHVAVPRFSEFNRLGIALTTRSVRPRRTSRGKRSSGACARRMASAAMWRRVRKSASVRQAP